MKLFHLPLAIALAGLTLLSACQQPTTDTLEAGVIQPAAAVSNSPSKITVLNFGTFHMGATTDANTVEFDENSKKNQEQVHAIAQKLAAFRPTVIVVEMPPAYDTQLQATYRQYCQNPEMTFDEPTEIELLAFELGRLTGVQKIYGIDHKMGYNYQVGSQISNTVDSVWYQRFFQDPLTYFPEVNAREDTLGLLQKLIQTNQDRYLDFLITANADMLTHAGTDEGFEGADEAAKFYQRNLRMYANLNRLPLQADDRVFILMGAAHTAFFRDFMSRSPKYQMVNSLEYLN